MDFPGTIFSGGDGAGGEIFLIHIITLAKLYNFSYKVNNIGFKTLEDRDELFDLQIPFLS